MGGGKDGTREGGGKEGGERGTSDDERRREEKKQEGGRAALESTVGDVRLAVAARSNASWLVFPQGAKTIVFAPCRY